MKDLKRLNAHMQNGEIEYVMCAANYHDDGKDHDFQPFNIDKGFVISGWRHGCVGSTFLAIARNFSGDENIPARWDDCEQGFLTTITFPSTTNKLFDFSSSLITQYTSFSSKIPYSSITPINLAAYLTKIFDFFLSYK